MDYYIRHKFKEDIIIPYVGLYPNIDFLNDNDAYAYYKDGVRAKIISAKEIHICLLESEIKAIYGLDVWSYIKKWYAFDKSMQTMYFLKIKAKKV